MRLIAISTHTRLRIKEKIVKNYYTEVEALLNIVSSKIRKNTHPFLKVNTHSSVLLIVIGSQKGLCGNFNTSIMHLTKQIMNQYKNHDFITLGKRTYDFVTNRFGVSPLLYFHAFKNNNTNQLASKIIDFIWNSNSQYQKVIVVNAFAKSFFSQIPQQFDLIPVQNKKLQIEHSNISFLYDQEPTILFDKLLRQYLTALLNCKIFETVIAEHAARFLSMDSATRNAKNILESTQLQYNKLRQAKITRELIELSGNVNNGF